MKPFPLRALRDWRPVRPEMCAFGGGSSGNTNTIQSSTPWSGQQDSLLNIYSQAANNYNTEQAGNNLQYYPGQTYAGLNQPQQGSILQAENYGGAGGDAAINAANANLGNTLSSNYTAGTSGAFNQGQGVLSSELDPSFLNPWNSPGFSSAVGNTLATVMPGITSSFTNGNRSDSGLASAAASQGATNAVGQLAQNQYNTNVGVQNRAEAQAANNYLTQQSNQTKGLLAAPSIDQSQLGDINAGLQAGTLSQQDAQNQINSLMAQYNYNQTLPYNALNMYESAVTGTGSPGGSTTTSQPYYNNTAANLLSAGVGAAGLASAASSAGLFSASTYAPLMAMLLG